MSYFDLKYHFISNTAMTFFQLSVSDASRKLDINEDQLNNRATFDLILSIRSIATFWENKIYKKVRTTKKNIRILPCCLKLVRKLVFNGTV